MARLKSLLGDIISRFDRLPPQEAAFKRFRDPLVGLAVFYGFECIATSCIEEQRFFLPLLKAGFAEESAPVFCKTRTGLEFALRFSGPLSVLRAYVLQKMNDLPHPLKFFFEGPSFYLNPGQGREMSMRPEWGLVMIGEESPVAEAEMVQIVWKGLSDAGLKSDRLEIRVNAIGCTECRPQFRSQFNAHLRNRIARLCKNCKRSLKRAPTKILVCSEEKCQMVAAHAPQVLDFLCEACKKHLRGFLEFLDEIRMSYFLDSHLFHEGSFFSTLLFEFVIRSAAGEGENKGHPFIFGEGGRFSRAGELVAGKRIDAAGAVIYPDKMAAFFSGEDAASRPGQEAPKIFLAQLGELAKRKSLGLMEVMRKNNIAVKELLGRDSVKSQLKAAENAGAEIALILGQKEALDSTIIVRELPSGIQETIPQEKLVEFLKKKLKK